MRLSNRLIGTSSALAMAAVSWNASAQDAGGQNDDTTETITVQGRSFRAVGESAASKLDIPIAETAAQVTIYTDEFLEDIGVYNFRDAVNYVPGVTTYANGYDSALFFVTRGFGVNGQNGVRVNNAPIGGEYFFDNVALDRIEYVKGAQAAAYGQISAAGFVNAQFISPKEEAGGQVTLRYDTFDTIRGEVTYNTPLTSNGSVRAVVAVASEHSNEFFDTPRGSDTQAIFGSIEADVTDKLTTQVSLYYDGRDGPFNAGAPLGEDLTDPLNPVYSVVSYDKDIYASGQFANVSSNFFFAQFLATYEFNDNHTLTANVSRIDANLEREVSEPFGFGYGEYVNLTPTSPNFGDANLDHFANDRDIKTTYAELRWTGAHDISDNVALNFIVSGEYNKIEQIFTGYDLDDANMAAPTLNLFNPVRTGGNPFEGKVFGGNFGFDNEVLSISLLTNFDLYERLRISLGVRYDDRQGQDNITDDVENIESFSTTNTVFSASVVYDITDNLHAYYAYGEGVEYLTSFTCDGGTLDPETNTSHEVGLKWEPTDNLIASIAYFNNTADNSPSEIEVCPTGSLLQSAAASGESDQFGEGFEIELIGQITPQWNVSAGISYLDDGIGESPFVTPKFSATFFTTYDFDSGFLEGFGIGGGIRMEFDRPVEADVDVPVNLADVPTFDPDVDASRNISFPDQVELGDFVAVDLALYYTLNESIDFALNVQNVFDEEYYSSFGDPFFNIIRQPPRNFTFTMNYKF
ncbi:MAG: TonB-dependent receptor [Pseudomonadota bacterium]